MVMSWLCDPLSRSGRTRCNAGKVPGTTGTPLLLLLTLVGSAIAADPPAAERLRVMTFNVAVGGEAMGQPLGRTAEAIRAAGADVVGLQEVHGRPASPGEEALDNGRRLAAMLGDGWRYLPQADNCGILTRLAPVEPTAGRRGHRLRTAAGTDVLVMNVHFEAAPYQPYQLCGVRYHPEAVFIKTEAEAVAHARAARGREVDALLAEVRASRRAGEPVFVTGDFNEPSHQDWTAAAVAAGRCPVAVAFPATRAIAEAGLTDAYRAAHPDPVRSPGLTWTPTTTPDDPKDRHDRIDFVFADVPGVRPAELVESAKTVGESADVADVVVRPWPSDHRAVVATVRLSRPADGGER